MFGFSKTSERAQEFDEGVYTRYKFASKFAKGKTTLDVGCGIGTGSKYLLKHGAKKVLGIDYSEQALQEAMAGAHKGLEFKKDDVLHLSKLGLTFDVVVAFEIIEHLPLGTFESFVASLKKVTKKGGYCLISTPNKNITSPDREKPYNPYHTKEFTPEELTVICKKVFKNVELYGIYCTNDNYAASVSQLKNSLWYQFILFVGSSRFVRATISIVPKSWRGAVTGEKTLPELSENDYAISKRYIKKSINLVAVCKN